MMAGWGRHQIAPVQNANYLATVARYAKIRRCGGDEKAERSRFDASPAIVLICVSMYMCCILVKNPRLQKAVDLWSTTGYV